MLREAEGGSGAAVVAWTDVGVGAGESMALGTMNRVHKLGAVT